MSVKPKVTETALAAAGWKWIRFLLPPKTKESFDCYQIKEGFQNQHIALDALLRDKLMNGLKETDESISDGEITIRKHQPL